MWIPPSEQATNPKCSACLCCQLVTLVHTRAHSSQALSGQDGTAGITSAAAASLLLHPLPATGHGAAPACHTPPCLPAQP